MAQPLANSKIRVRLAKGLQSVELKGVDLKVYVDKKSVQPILPPPHARAPAIEMTSSRVQIERAYQNHLNGWKIRWDGNSQTTFKPGHDLEIRGVTLRMGILSLPQRVHFVGRESQDKDRFKFDLISHLDLERYLLGVLPSEMPLSWPLEALKAQAVAARSFAVAVQKERVNQDFDVESSVMDQAFEYSPEAMNTVKWSDKANLVIQSTKGKVLLGSKGIPMKAYYHSDCGGKTELARRVWGGIPNQPLGGVKSCPHGAESNWEFQISHKDLERQIIRVLGVKNRSGLASVKLSQPNSSDRIDAVILAFRDGFILKISSQEFRRAIGFSDLKSTHFQLVQKDGRLRFLGRGFGHGVGMCQYGAKNMASQGKSYDEILEFYFPASNLVSLSESLLSFRSE